MEKYIDIVTTGFKSLDEYLEGFKPGQLITIASRPGIGKTSLALNIAIKGCLESKSALHLFTLEMGAKDVSTRILASTAKVDIRKLRTKDWNSLDQDKLNQANFEIQALPIDINDNEKISFSEIFNICKMKKEKGELGLVVIDYLQLLAGNENPKIWHRERVTTLYRNLKSLAKELKCPVIVLSQLDIVYDPVTNEKIHSTERPTTACLRDTADADVILILHRDDFHNYESKNPEVVEVIIYKNRAGATGIVNLQWVGNYMGFEDLDE